MSFVYTKFYITKSFSIDWAQKKELFIGMMLRAYSQEVFNPQSVFEEEGSEVGFTNRIEGFMKDFIINQLAGDTNAIRKEVKQLIINVCIYVYIYIYIYFRLCPCTT